MKQTLTLILAAAIAAVPVAAVAATAPAGSEPRPAFQGLFVDWSNANRQSIEAERRAVPTVDAGAAVGAAGTTAGSRSLGERVGEIVSTGDCSEGERVARAAGDFALVAAVREHCNAAPESSR